MMLDFVKNKKIVIASEYKKGDYQRKDLDKIIKILESCEIQVYEASDYKSLLDLNEIYPKGYCCDVVIIDAANPVYYINKLKLQCSKFATILYDRHISELDFHYENEISIYSRVDQFLLPTFLQSLSNEEDDKTLKEAVLSRVISAIKIHQAKNNHTLDMLEKFIKSMKSINNGFYMMSASRIDGTIMAVTENAKSFFGDDVVGKNINEYGHKINGKKIQNPTSECFPAQVGAVIQISGVDGRCHNLRLINNWVIENGCTYYLQTWEIVDEIHKIHEIIDRLNRLETKIDKI
jgi:hypothetical protein